MIAAAAAALLLAAVGLLAVRTAPPAARVLAWLAALAFAAVAFAVPDAQWRARAGGEARANLQGEATAMRSKVLAAASVAAPGAASLRLQWRPDGDTVPGGALGALVAAPPPLPFEPAALRVEALDVPACDRPVVLQVRGPALATPLPAQLRIRRGSEIVHRADIVLGASAAAVEVRLATAGAYELELEVRAGAHTVTARGALPVVAAPTVLVLEPSGTVAAALRAQGVDVVAVDDWRAATWRDHAAVVLGAPLPDDAQRELAAAVRDGRGALVLAPAFGAPGAPLGGLLPVQPFAEQPDPHGDGKRAGGGEPSPALPPDVPPPSPRPEPPRGDTAGAARPSDEPIEVDKHAIAMVLVVDRSGSMGTLLPDGKTKMSYAKTSALRTRDPESLCSCWFRRIHGPTTKP
ncbi:MAG: hypothetical protein QM755_22530 [Luteolibacter sp.]